MLRNKGRMWKLGAALALTAVVAAACGDDATDDTAGGDAAAAESITVYTGRSEELIGDLVDQFTEETGIEVKLRGGDSGELAAQILTEGDASPADLFFSQDAGALGALAKGGLLTELDADVISGVPAKFRATDGTWVGTSGRARVLVYNPTTVAEPPTGIDQLLEPEWKGRLGFAPSNASFQSFVTALRVLRGEDGAREWLEGFAANEPQAFENNVAVRDAVDAGEIDLGLVNHYYLYEKIAELGEDKVVARNQFLGGGDAGGLINVAGVGVLRSADNPDGAERFVEYLLSDAGQEYFATETFEYPLVEGVEASPELPPLAELQPPDIDLADLDSIAATQELLADVGLLQQ